MITLLCLNNEYLALLSEGRAHLISINDDSTQKIFPLKDTEDVIFCIALTDDFFFYSDSNNKLKMYQISENFSNIVDYYFENPIRKVYIKY